MLRRTGFKKPKYEDYEVAKKPIVLEYDPTSLPHIRSGEIRVTGVRTPVTRHKPRSASKLPKTAKAIKPKKKSLKSLKTKLWNLCREITRAKYGNTCYTCGKTGLEGGNWQTSHFIPSSICTVSMRYSLDNLRPACYHCNINLSGNWVSYEERLDQEKGHGFANRLKQINRKLSGSKYDSTWYTSTIEEYEKIARDMETNKGS